MRARHDSHGLWLHRFRTYGFLHTLVSHGIPLPICGHEDALLPDSLLCEAFNYMLHLMNDTWGPLLTLDVGRLVPQLESFAEALQAWGCPLPLCWAFIDGTVRGICR